MCISRLTLALIGGYFLRKFSATVCMRSLSHSLSLSPLLHSHSKWDKFIGFEFLLIVLIYDRDKMLVVSHLTHTVRIEIRLYWLFMVIELCEIFWTYFPYYVSLSLEKKGSSVIKFNYRLICISFIFIFYFYILSIIKSKIIRVSISNWKRNKLICSNLFSSQSFF